MRIPTHMTVAISFFFFLKNYLVLIRDLHQIFMGFCVCIHIKTHMNGKPLSRVCFLIDDLMFPVIPDIEVYFYLSKDSDWHGLMI